MVVDAAVTTEVDTQQQLVAVVVQVIFEPPLQQFQLDLLWLVAAAVVQAAKLRPVVVADTQQVSLVLRLTVTAKVAEAELKVRVEQAIQLAVVHLELLVKAAMVACLVLTVAAVEVAVITVEEEVGLLQIMAQDSQAAEAVALPI